MIGTNFLMPMNVPISKWLTGKFEIQVEFLGDQFLVVGAGLLGGMLYPKDSKSTVILSNDI